MLCSTSARAVSDITAERLVVLELLLQLATNAVELRLARGVHRLQLRLGRLALIGLVDRALEVHHGDGTGLGDRGTQEKKEHRNVSNHAESSRPSLRL